MEIGLLDDDDIPKSKDQLRRINVRIVNHKFLLASSERLNIIGIRNASSNVM